MNVVNCSYWDVRLDAATWTKTFVLSSMPSGGMRRGLV